MKHIKVVGIGAVAAALFLGAGCKSDSVKPNDPQVEQGTGGAGVDSSADSNGSPGGGINAPGSHDSAKGTGLGGAGSIDGKSAAELNNGDSGKPGLQNKESDGTGGSGEAKGSEIREPATGTTQGNDASHSGAVPGAHQGDKP
jgi:hypothetical protein